MTFDETVKTLAAHNGSKFLTQRDNVPKAGWYCRCGQMLASNLPYDEKHLATHQANMISIPFEED